MLVAIEGAGAAAFWPSQSTLIARLTPAARRHAAFAQQRLTMNLGLGLGGITGGLLAHVRSPGTFTALFLLDALTFLGYVVVLAFIHDPGAERRRGSAPGVLSRRAPAPDLRRALAAELPVRRRRLLADHAVPAVRPRPRRRERARDRSRLRRQHGRDRDRAAAARALDRGAPPDARAGDHAGALGDRLADRRRRGRVAARDRGLRRLRARRRRCSGSASAFTARPIRRSSPTSARLTFAAATSRSTPCPGASAARSGRLLGGFVLAAAPFVALAGRGRCLPCRRGRCTRARALHPARCCGGFPATRSRSRRSPSRWPRRERPPAPRPWRCRR